VRCPAWLCQRMSARVDSANAAASRSLMPSRAAHNGPRRAAS
jgi:hypothetical protein